MHPSGNFCQWRVFEIVEPGTQICVRRKQIPQPCGTRLWFQFLDDRGRCPAFPGDGVGLDLVMKPMFVRIDVLIEKRRQTLLQIDDLGGEIEIHC